MKKILILAAFASALIVSAFGGTTASAASAEEDDFNAYIVATGEECLTEYYNSGRRRKRDCYVRFTVEKRGRIFRSGGG